MTRTQPNATMDKTANYKRAVIVLSNYLSLGTAATHFLTVLRCFGINISWPTFSAES